MLGPTELKLEKISITVKSSKYAKLTPDLITKCRTLIRN